MTPVCAQASSNRLELTGFITELDSLRYTPAGLPALNFRLGHRSKQLEAGLPREVEVDMPAKALGELARLLAAAPLDRQIKAVGFLAHKSAKSRQPILHVTAIEFLEGR